MMFRYKEIEDSKDRAIECVDKFDEEGMRDILIF